MSSTNLQSFHSINDAGKLLIGVSPPPPQNILVHDIPQVDGNVSIESSTLDDFNSENIETIKVHVGFRPQKMNSERPHQCLKKVKINRKSSENVDAQLPSIVMYNMRSFFPKQNNFCIDFDEREIDLAFLTEVWEKKENRKHRRKLEEMLELKGI